MINQIMWPRLAEQMRNARNYVQRDQPQDLIEIFRSGESQFSNENMNELIKIALETFHAKCLLICVAKSFSNGFFYCKFDKSKIGLYNGQVNYSDIRCLEHLLNNLHSFDSGLDKNVFAHDQPNLTFDEWANLIVTNNYNLFEGHHDIINTANNIRRQQCDSWRNNITTKPNCLNLSDCNVATDIRQIINQSISQQVSGNISSKIHSTTYIPHFNISISPSIAIPLPNDLLAKIEILRQEVENKINLDLQQTINTPISQVSENLFSEIQPTPYMAYFKISIFPSIVIPLPNDLLDKLELLRQEVENKINLAVQNKINLAVQTHYES